MFQINNKKERKKEPVQSCYKRTRVFYYITGLQMWKGAYSKATLFLFHCASGMPKDL